MRDREKEKGRGRGGSAFWLAERRDWIGWIINWLTDVCFHIHTLSISRCRFETVSNESLRWATVHSDSSEGFDQWPKECEVQVFYLFVCLFEKNENLRLSSYDVKCIINSLCSAWLLGCSAVNCIKGIDDERSALFFFRKKNICQSRTDAN